MRVRTMYARQRVFAGAPPTYVVAMLLQLSWLPIWLANLVGIEVPHTNDIRSTFAQIGSAYIVAASWGLARRASGRVAWGAAIAFIANSVTVAFQVYLIYLLDHRNGLDGIESTLRVVAWVFPICISVATVALAVAAGRGAMPVTIPMIASLFFIDYRAAWVCTGVTCFALIPALVRTAKKLRADPVKTTADVFA